MNLIDQDFKKRFTQDLRESPEPILSNTLLGFFGGALFAAVVTLGLLTLTGGI